MRKKLARLQPRVRLATTVLVSPIVPDRLRGGAATARNHRFLAAHPWCAHCGARATEVDHTIPLHMGGADDESNLQGLCHGCHAAKTALEQSARASP